MNRKMKTINRLLMLGMLLTLFGAAAKLAEAQTVMEKLDAYWGAFQVGGTYTTIPGLHQGVPATAAHLAY